MAVPRTPTTLIFLLFFLFPLSVQQSFSSLQQKSALLQLRSSLGIRSNDWPIRSDPCTSWTGIRCYAGTVVGLNISGFRRTRLGRLNPQFSIDAIRNLTQLSSFNASHFPLPGPIPVWFGLQPAGLEVLDLRSCSITGGIPAAFGNFSNLSRIYLSNNNLTGAVPPTVFQLPALSVLDLSHNKLNGTIADSLWSIPSLQFLDLSVNNFTGVLPDIDPLIFYPTATSNLSVNKFYGNITPVIRRFGFSDMSENYFEGKVPAYARGRTSVVGNCLLNWLTQRTMTECKAFYGGRNMVLLTYEGVKGTPAEGNMQRRRRSVRKMDQLAITIFGAVFFVLFTIGMLRICFHIFCPLWRCC